MRTTPSSPPMISPLRTFTPWRSLFLVLLALAAIGCSNTTVKRVFLEQDAKTSSSPEGFRYYGSTLYLLVTSPVVLTRTEELVTLNAGARTLTPFSSCEFSPCIPAPAPSGTPGVPPPPPPPPPPASPTPAPAVPTSALSKTDKKTTKPKAAPADPAAPVVGGKDTSKGDTAPASPQDPSKTADTPSSAPSSSANKGAVAIVWLPDYCEQYAVSSSNVLSSHSLKLKLNDGWQFDNVDASNDSTVVIGKVLDAVTSVVGAFKGSTTSTTGGTSSKTSKGTGAQAGTERIFRHTKTVSLKPGLYRIFTRKPTPDPKDACTVRPEFAADEFKTVVSESWEELPLPAQP